MHELKSLGGHIFDIVTEGDEQMEALADEVIEVPEAIISLAHCLASFLCKSLPIMWQCKRV